MAKKYDSPISYKLRKIPVKYIKVWRDAQARKLDREGIPELARSIKNDGLQNPPLVQRDGKNRYLLMSGQRRLAALKRLGAKVIPVLVLTNATKYDLEEAKAASVVENLHRNKMNTKDMTSACILLTEKLGKTKAAKSLGISAPTLNKYLGFAAVPEKLKHYVPKELSRDDAVRLYQATPNIASAEKIAVKIIPLDKKIRREYLKALLRTPKATHKKLLKKAKARTLQQRLVITLNKTNATKLKRLADKRDADVLVTANDILTSYLRKRK